jgi:hypothetical protein
MRTLYNFITSYDQHTYYFYYTVILNINAVEYHHNTVEYHHNTVDYYNIFTTSFNYYDIFSIYCVFKYNVQCGFADNSFVHR